LQRPEVSVVAIDEKQHVALPKLYGQPAYARPPRRTSPAPRPFDPDDLPLQVTQTAEERDWIESLPARAYAPGGGVMMAVDGGSATAASGSVALNGRPFRLKTLAGKLFGGPSSKSS
jgi:hypothetical protein